MEIEFLGTGTSTGIPQIGCNCSVCKSTDAHDKRLRTSAIIHADDGKEILIDCGPDFRQQILHARYHNPCALLVTHSHYDHVGGIDDLRPFCAHGKFPIYAREDVLNDIRTRLPYCFVQHPYPGVPSFDMIPIDKAPFHIGTTCIEPLHIWHYKLLISGFKINDRAAYITDAKHIDNEVIQQLNGIPTLIINALRISEHISHMSLSQALEVIERIAPARTYLIHMSHDMGLEREAAKTLPHTVNFAHDGLVITI